MVTVYQTIVSRSCAAEGFPIVASSSIHTHERLFFITRRSRWSKVTPPAVPTTQLKLNPLRHTVGNGLLNEVIAPLRRQRPPYRSDVIIFTQLSFSASLSCVAVIIVGGVHRRLLKLNPPRHTVSNGLSNEVIAPLRCQRPPYRSDVIIFTK